MVKVPESVVTDIRDFKQQAIYFIIPILLLLILGKLANILYVKVLNEKYPQIQSIAIHPGVIATNLVTSLDFATRMFVYIAGGKFYTVAEGIKNTLYCATMPKEELPKDCSYLEPVGLAVTPSKLAQDMDLANSLYDWTQKELQPFL